MRPMTSVLPLRVATLHRALAALPLLLPLLFALCGVLPHPAQAQSAGDPPGRVARLSAAEGQVWVYTPDNGDWIAAQRNQPLTSGDRIATDAGARAELQVGSTTLRLDSGTELAIIQLDDDRLALRLEEGGVIARLRDPAGAGQFELDTDEGRFVAPRAGTYRVGREGDRSELTVYGGEARYEGPNSALPLEAGQRAEFWIDSGGVAQYSTMAPRNDAFLAWSSDRDRRAQAVVAERYVSPEMTGIADLDAYGRWEQIDDYGPVWIPAVSNDWAPYSQGRWAWVAPWGWTWIDDAPWGFAPFHYGRWVHVRNNWCWTPGARIDRPVYAPALVGWIGGPRGNVSVTIGGGPAVGWVPLAPREVYVPSYRASPRYAERINISYVNSAAIRTVIEHPQAPRDFDNRRVPRGLTVVPGSVLTERRPVGPAAAQYRQTPWVRDLAQGSPGRVAAVVAPPVAAPVVAARPPARDRANEVRPPPGFDRGAPPSVRERSPQDRAREGRDRDARRPDLPSTPPPGQAPAPGPQFMPGGLSPEAGANGRNFERRPPRPPGFRSEAAEQGRPAAAGQAPLPSNVGQPPLPAATGQPPYPVSGQAPAQLPPSQRPEWQRQSEDRGRPPRPSPPPQPQPQMSPQFQGQPAPQQRFPIGQQPPAPMQPPVREVAPGARFEPPRPDGPTMRALPVQRGEERRPPVQVQQVAPPPRAPQAPPPMAPPEVRAPAPVQPMVPQGQGPGRPSPPVQVAPPARPAPPSPQPADDRRGDPHQR